MNAWKDKGTRAYVSAVWRLVCSLCSRTTTLVFGRKIYASEQFTRTCVCISCNVYQLVTSAISRTTECRGTKTKSTHPLHARISCSCCSSQRRKPTAERETSPQNNHNVMTMMMMIIIIIIEIIITTEIYTIMTQKFAANQIRVRIKV